LEVFVGGFFCSEAAPEFWQPAAVRVGVLSQHDLFRRTTHGRHDLRSGNAARFRIIRSPSLLAEFSSCSTMTSCGNNSK
jgi:hypothetical protein